MHTVKGVVFDDIDRGPVTGMYHRARLLMSGRLGINIWATCYQINSNLHRCNMKRSRSPTTPTNPKKRQRLTIEQKREVICKLKLGASVAHVAQQFGIGVQTVRDIKKRETELDRYQISFGFTPKRKSLKRPVVDNIDEATYTWFKAQRAAAGFTLLHFF